MSVKNQITTSDYLEFSEMEKAVLLLERDKEYALARLILCGSYWGLRISDLLSIKFNDVIEMDELRVQEKKTSKYRLISIHEKVNELIQRHFNELNYELDDFLFARVNNKQLYTPQHINRKLKSVFKRYGLAKGKRISTHSLRKTFGRKVWSSDNYSERSLTYLNMLFGHANQQTTLAYLGIRQEELSNVYLSF